MLKRTTRRRPAKRPTARKAPRKKVPSKKTTASFGGEKKAFRSGYSLGFDHGKKGGWRKPKGW